MKLLKYIVFIAFFSDGVHAACIDDTLVSPHCGKTPSVVFNNKQQLYVAFVQNNHIWVSRSDDLGKTFTSAVKVNAQPQNFYTNGENRPKIALGPDNTLYISWTKKTDGMYTGDIQFSRSTDGGKRFEPSQTINTDGLLTSHRFDSLSVTPSGLIYLTWLDKRDKVAAKKRGEQYRGSAVYYAFSQDKGKTFSDNIKIADHSCECCRVATTASDNSDVGVLWRHIYQGSIRDHAFTTLNKTSIDPIFRSTKDDWRLEACPHHGPAITSVNDEFYITWFTGGEANKGIYFGVVDSEKKSLKNKTRIDGPGASHPHISHIEGETYLVWKNFMNDSTAIYYSSSSNKGKTWTKPRIVGKTNSRSDHPLLVTSTDTLYLSWHTQDEGLRIRALN